LLIASGAGAGLAAVYNVPLGGAVFTLEVVLGSWERRAILPALITSVLATTTAWAIIGNHPTYDVAHWTLTVDLLIFSIVIGPLSGLAAIAFVRLMAFARASKPSGWRLIPSTTIVFAAIGVLAIAYPHLLGNGKGPAQQAFDGHGSVLFLASLVVLKPLATAACLRSGAVGGVFTPALATGALFGAATGTAWLHLWPGAALGSFALAGAAGLLSGTLRAPFSAIVLMLELTHAAPEMIAPVVLAVAGATLTFRGVNYGSIYRPHPRERPVTR
jgi:H+/Cl- antiporter ClcA